jgi:hypothetical protein
MARKDEMLSKLLKGTRLIVKDIGSQALTLTES